MAQFEDFGRVIDVTISPNKHMRGIPDSKIALVEFEKKDDARKAMQALNGRHVQGKCVMIRFARSAPGVRTPAPLPRHSAPELIPQTATAAKLLAAKFQPCDGPKSVSRSRSCSRNGKNVKERKGRSKSRDKERDRKGATSTASGRRSPAAASAKGGPRRSRERSRQRSRERSRQRSRHRSGERSRRRGSRPRRSSPSPKDGVSARGRRRSPSRWRPSPG